jgi:glutathione S-transferase
LLPSQRPARWAVLVEQSLADGMMDAAVLTRYETAVRPESLRWDAWVAGQLEKVTCGLAQIEQSARALANRIDVGTIAIACSLGYLDFRFASLGWRAKYPNAAAWFNRFAERDSMQTTRPESSHDDFAHLNHRI